MEKNSFKIAGLSWRVNWRLDNGQDSYVVPFPTLRPVTLVFHGETKFSYGHYGVHLGQADVLTFLGAQSHVITGHFIDCRKDSPTTGLREQHQWSPDSAYSLSIPPGVAHSFDNLEGIHTLNSYELFLPDPQHWADGSTNWRPDADVLNIPIDIADDELPEYRPNQHEAGEAWYDLVASRQRSVIPSLFFDYPVVRDVAFLDGNEQRVRLRRPVDTEPKKAWEPVGEIAGVGWAPHPVVRSGPESGFVALTDRYPLYFVDHGETSYTHDAYGIHLGQEDRLTFVGPRDQEVTLNLIDTRTDSPSFRCESRVFFRPDPERYLVIPPGIGHAFERLENVFTINRPQTFLPEDGAKYKPGNDVIDWPLAKRPIPSLQPNTIPAPGRHYESQVADQKKLRALRVQHSTPAVLLFQPENGEPVRVALRKKAVVR
jgi:dTDP-4-dehydrorhamnose 3,5-epimerase-like enzyme